MSNLIYGPDGNPIPQEEEHTSPESKNSKKEEKTPIPYGKHYTSSHVPENPIPQYNPYKRGPLEIAALVSGFVAIFMVGYTNYYTIFLMFAAGLAAVVLSILSKKKNGRFTGMTRAALIMGIIGLVMFFMTIFVMIYMVNHPEVLEQYVELYEQMYEQLTNQPSNIRNYL